jgi:predicted nucleic acid-binding protein
MIVIADTSPICYLLLIGQIDLLPRLYGQVMISTIIQQELADANSPPVVRLWIAEPPIWLTVVEMLPINAAGLENLDLGEQSAIALAETFKADLLIIDELLGRQVAQARGLRITGLLGVLQAAARQGWINLPETIQALRQTSFRASERLLRQVLNDVG